MNREASEVREVSPGYELTGAKPLVPEGYKQTDIGVIPEDWSALPLKGRVSISHGFAFSSKYFSSYGQFLLTTPGHFFEEGGFRDIGEKQKFYSGPVPRDYVLSPGDMIVAMTEQAEGLLGSAALVPNVEGYLHNQRLGRVTGLSEEVELGYLQYVLNSPSFRARVRETAVGTKVKHTSPDKLLEISVSLPPAPEQRAISTALGDLDALLRELDRLIVKKRDIKKATMQQLLTGQTRLPGFEGVWQTIRLGEHVTFIKSGTNSRAELTGDGTVRYLHYGDIHASSSSTLSPDALPFLPANKAKNLGRLQAGDLVLADASEDMDGIGKSVEINSVDQREVVAGLHTIAARFDKSILSDGFKAYLQFFPDFISPLRRLAAGTKVYATTRSHIAKIVMRLPGVEEQRAISEILNDIDNDIKALKKRRTKSIGLKQAMMQELLTGKIRL